MTKEVKTNIMFMYKVQLLKKFAKINNLENSEFKSIYWKSYASNL